MLSDFSAGDCAISIGTGIGITKDSCRGSARYTLTLGPGRNFPVGRYQIVSFASSKYSIVKI